MRPLLVYGFIRLPLGVDTKSCHFPYPGLDGDKHYKSLIRTNTTEGWIN